MKKLIRGKKARMERALEEALAENNVMKARIMDLETYNFRKEIDRKRAIEQRDRWKARAIAALILIIVQELIIGIIAFDSHAETRYTTQTVALRDSRTGETLRKVKRNTKVDQIKAGKVWARVTYKGEKFKVKTKHLANRKAVRKCTGARFKRTGVVFWDNHKFTWYSQRALPGHGLKIPGRHVDKQGFVCDKYGYIVLGSNTANRGRIIPTPFGKFGKVYDAGWVGTYWFDVYTAF